MKSVSPVDLNGAARAVAYAAKTRFAGKKDDTEQTPGGIILPDTKLLTDVFGYAGVGNVGTTHMSLIRGMDLLKPGDKVLVDAPAPKSMRLVESGDPPRAALLTRVISNDRAALVLQNPFATEDGDGPPAIGINKTVFSTSVDRYLERGDKRRNKYGHLPPTLDSLVDGMKDPDKPWETPDLGERELAPSADRFDENMDTSANGLRLRRRSLTDFLGLNERLLRGLDQEDSRIRELADRRKVRSLEDMPEIALPTGKLASGAWHKRIRRIINALTRRGQVIEPGQVRDRDMRVRVRGFVGPTPDDPLKVIVAPDEDGYQTPTQLKALSPWRLFDPTKWATQLLSPFSPTAREHRNLDVPPDARLFYTLSPKALKVVKGQDNLFVLNPSHN